MKKSTNLQVTRFFAAVLVIFSHSFALTQGTDENEWLMIATKAQLSFGGLAVALFFLCGGYLTAKGMEHYSGFVFYFLHRLSRILPDLIFVVLCCVVGGAFITTLSVHDYWTNIGTWRYLLNGLMVLQHNLPGVFEEAKYMPTVNGALWTLPVEFLCNISCCIAYKLGFLEKRRFLLTAPLVAAGAISMYALGSKAVLLRAVIRPCLMFYVGIIYWIYRDKITYKATMAWLSLFLLVFCGMCGILYLGMLLLFPYVMMTFWFGVKQHFRTVSKLGDFSYALYLWGFPTQQFVAEQFDWNISPYLNTVISVLISFVLAVITYYLVENASVKVLNEISNENL